MMFDVKLKSPGEVSYSLLENRGYRSLNYRNALWYWMGGGGRQRVFPQDFPSILWEYPLSILPCNNFNSDIVY